LNLNPGKIETVSRLVSSSRQKFTCRTMGKGRTRNARADKKDRVAAGLQVAKTSLSVSCGTAL